MLKIVSLYIPGHRRPRMSCLITRIMSIMQRRGSVGMLVPIASPCSRNASPQSWTPSPGLGSTPCISSDCTEFIKSCLNYFYFYLTTSGRPRLHPCGFRFFCTIPVGTMDSRIKVAYVLLYLYSQANLLCRS